MSFADPEAEPVQPDEGQGDGEAAGGSPWESYLERFPEEVRDTAAEAFREMEGNATKRFQEHSEYRKTWEPYEQLGVSQVSPEDVQWALQFRQAAVENPQAIQQWFDAYAQEHGLTPQQAAAEIQQQQDDLGYDPSQQQLDQMLKQHLSPLQQQVEQMSQWRTQIEEQAHQDQITRALDTEVAALKAKHADSLPDELKERFDDVIERFAMKYAQPGADPKRVIALAWQDFESLSNQIEKAALQGKVDAPAPAESGGVPDVSPDKIHSFKQAESVAAEFLRNSNRA